MSASSPRPRRIHPDAWLSFFLGLASLALLLLALTGLPALLIGLRGLRAINRSDGALGGARLAVAGMILGGVGTLATILGIAAIWILRAEENSRYVECINHLRQIGVALNKYADQNGSFPPAAVPSKDLPPERRISWMADVLPLLGEGTPSSAKYQELAAELVRDRAWDDPANAKLARTRLRVFVCPAKFDATPGTTQYVGMAGVGLDAAALKRDDPGAGVFGFDRGVARKEVTAGNSYTMMVLETARENGPWLAAGAPTVRGLEPELEHYCGPGRPFGGLHYHCTNVLWVDGSARPLSDDTPGRIVRAHARIRGGE
jgi:hypothetical protein